jgi:C-terminal processing protease CtpA/Prc
MRIDQFKKYLLLILIFISASASTFARNFTPINLDYELGEPGTTPNGWSIKQKDFDEGFDALISKEQAYSGTQSVIFSFNPKKSAKADGAFFQEIDARNFRNREIEFSAYIKTDYKTEQEAAYMFISVYSKDLTFNSFKTNIEKTGALLWKKYTVKAKVPSDADFIKIGFNISSPSSIYIDSTGLSFTDIINANSHTLNKSEIKDLIAFSELFSAVAFYYPSLALEKMDLQKLAYSGINTILNSSNKLELKDKLLNIFQPYAPELKIESKDNPKIKFNKDKNPDIYYSRIYVGAKSDNNNRLLFSQLKDVNKSLHQFEGAISQTIPVSQMQGDECVFSAEESVIPDKYKAKTAYSINFYDDKNKLIGVSGLDQADKEDLSAGRKKATFSFAIPKDADQMTVYLLLYGDGVVDFDNVSIKNTTKKEELIANGSFNEAMNGWKFEELSEYEGYDVALIPENTKSKSFKIEISKKNEEYPKYPKLDDFYKIPLSGKLTAYFPKATINADTNFTDNISTIAIQSTINDAYSKYSDIVYAWTFFKNFSFHKIDAKEYLKSLEAALTKADEIKNEDQLSDLIRTMLAGVKDNSLKVWSAGAVNSKPKSLPFIIEKIKDKYIISSSIDSNISVCDEIIKINSIDAKVFFNSLIESSSASTDEYRLYKALSAFRFSDNFDKVELTIKSNNKIKHVVANRTSDFSDLYKNAPNPIEKIGEGVWYIDLRRIDDRKLGEFFKMNYESVKALLLDCRANTSISEAFFKFFKKKAIKPTQFRIPIFTDYLDRFASYKYYKQDIIRSGKLEEVKLMALCDETSIGTSETHLHLLRANNLGKIVGRPSSGCPNDVAALLLPCGITISYSSIFAADKDGKILDGTPFEPDFKVEKTLNDIKSGIDPIYEKGKEEILKLIGK